MYLNVECDVQLRYKHQDSNTDQGGGRLRFTHRLQVARPHADDINAKMSKVGECAGLAFQ